MYCCYWCRFCASIIIMTHCLLTLSTSQCLEYEWYNLHWRRSRVPHQCHRLSIKDRFTHASVSAINTTNTLQYVCSWHNADTSYIKDYLCMTTRRVTAQLFLILTYLTRYCHRHHHPLIMADDDNHGLPKCSIFCIFQQQSPSSLLKIRGCGWTCYSFPCHSVFYSPDTFHHCCHNSPLPDVVSPASTRSSSGSCAVDVSM